MLTGRFNEALLLALELHAQQTRKGTDIPYISHVLLVAGLVLDYGGSEDEAIAGLLHDAVEDQGGKETLEKIRSRFGDVVAEVVAECSDTDVFPKPRWRERKEAHLKRLREASASVRLVEAADKLHNVQAIIRDYRNLGEGLWRRFNAGRDEILWYYREMVNALRVSGVHPLIDELGRRVSELEQIIKK